MEAENNPDALEAALTEMRKRGDRSAFDEFVKQAHHAMGEARQEWVVRQTHPALPAVTATPTEIAAAAMRRARQSVDWTARDLADAMRRLGWDWHPHTVQNIEHRRQKLYLDELAGLAAIFNTAITAFLIPHEEETRVEIGPDWTISSHDWLNVLSGMPDVLPKWSGMRAALPDPGGDWLPGFPGFVPAWYTYNLPEEMLDYLDYRDGLRAALDELEGGDDAQI